MSWPIQDHANAVLQLLSTAPGSPALQVLDGFVSTGTTAPYVLIYVSVESLDGQSAPDVTSLTFDSTALDTWVYAHCVGGSAPAARAVAGRVRAALLNARPAVAGWSCNPIRWSEGQPPQRDEETGAPVFDQVDIYRWRSVPG